MLINRIMGFSLNKTYETIIRKLKERREKKFLKLNDLLKIR